MTNALAEHIAAANKQDSAAFLGRLLWYTCDINVRSSHRDVVAGLKAAGLNSLLPPAPKDFDIFRRVSSSAGLLKVPTGVKGVVENYTVREVSGAGEDQVVRKIVCETMNRNSKNLNYSTELREITFSKSTGRLWGKDIQPPAPPVSDQVASETWQRQRNMCDAIEMEIKNQFNHWSGYLNHYAIRETVRRMILNIFNATLVREGGGVYFVQEENAKQVEALEDFVNSIQGASFHSLPLLDNEKQREMIKQAYEAETVGAIDEMLAEISDARVKGTKISQKRYSEYLSQYKQLIDKTNGYSDLLEEKLGESRSRLMLFQTSVIQLKTQVRA